MRLWLLGVLLATSAAQAAPVTLEHQARLLDITGEPISGPVSVSVSLFGSELATDPSWTDSYQLTLDDGYFNVLLGAQGNLDAAELAGPRWIELSVAGGKVGERIPVRPVPSAVYAHTAQSLAGSSVTATPSGGLRVGNYVLNAWSGALPDSFTGTGTHNGALQLKTALHCANNSGKAGYMWHIEFAGHDYQSSTPFRVVSVGYAQPHYPDEIQNLGVVVDYGPVRVAAYCSSDKWLSFELTNTNGQNPQWHASDLTINLLHGASGYEQTASNLWRVTALRGGSRF